jgi:MFS transporter, DHA1 family, solute carrier family 18 (vesicular amine transporter), member 1/2
VAAFMFNLGQGVLRPSLPLYLQQFFGANYRMVTVIPTVFGAGKWIANLPTGYLLDRVGRRPLMITGLAVIASSDIASALTSAYGVFLGIRGVAGIGWAMFATVATTVMVDRGARRGRAISRLLMAETTGVLLGSVGGGWLYTGVGATSPFLFEAACVIVAGMAAGWLNLPPPPREASSAAEPDHSHRLRAVIRAPGVMLMSITNAALVAVQTGVIVFLFPLYLLQRGHLAPEVVGYLVGVTFMGRLLALWLVSRLPDRWSRLPVLGLGLLGYAVILASLPLVTHLFLLINWSLLLGVGAGFVAGLPTAIIGDRVAPEHHGIAVGWLRTLADAGMIVGPLVMGTLGDVGGLGAPFVCAAALVCALAWPCYCQTPISGTAS